MRSPTTPSPSLLATIMEDVTAVLPRDMAEAEWHHVGAIDLASGKIVTFDPFMLSDALPFSRAISCGTYSLRLLMVRYHNGDQRIAAAALVFDEDRFPQTWKLATLGEQDNSDVDAEDGCGLSVDSGVAGFACANAVAELESCVEEDPDYLQRIVDEMDRNAVDSCSWAIHPVGDGGNRIAVYSSGLGDGVYISHWGFDSDGHAVLLLQDFGLLDP